MIKNIHHISSVIGQALKNKRRQLGLSGIELSKILSISQQQISRYERGVNCFNLDMLMRYFAALQMTPNDVNNLFSVLGSYYHHKVGEHEGRIEQSYYNDYGK